MPRVGSKGAQSSQGFGQFAATQAAPAGTYIEDVFSAWLYTGNNTLQTISNSINLSTNGGLVWIKNRDRAANWHVLTDTARGASNLIYSNLTDAQINGNWGVSSFTQSGFTVNSQDTLNNISGDKYISWAFRKQSKFFDIVTWTGNGANRTIAHNLGAVPGCIIVKRTDTTSDWAVYHNSLANTEYLVLNTTAAKATGATYWNSTTATSTVFSLGTASDVNASGGTYVAYLFANNAGGFGDSSTDNAITCNSFTTDASGNATITLGYESQFLLIKGSNSVSDWLTIDSTRRFGYSGTYIIFPNSASVEDKTTILSNQIVPTATGFKVAGALTPSTTYIYVAVRRGPMKTPTTGTSVFNTTYTSGAEGTVITTGFPVDLQLFKNRSSTEDWVSINRIGGVNPDLNQTGSGVGSEVPFYPTNSNVINYTNYKISKAWVNNSYQIPAYNPLTPYSFYSFKRAPKFYDQVYFTSNAISNQRINHNLAIAPQLIMIRNTSAQTGWYIYFSSFALSNYLNLSATSAVGTIADLWGTSAPTSTDFGLKTSAFAGSGNILFAHLFATISGISKVGSYSGTGASQVINCEFTGGARFVLIKRTDSTGNWYIYDTARGMTSSTDPYLLLNSTAAETTGTDYVETSSTGFTITSTAPAAINANGGTFVFLAIA